MIYQYALPLTLPRYRDVRVGGEVVSPTHMVPVRRGAPRSQFVEDLGALIRRLAADTPPQAGPEPARAHFCGISAGHCPDRIEGASMLEMGQTVDF